jgi:hypothetical protein
VRPDGSKAYVLEVNKAEYRSFRIQTLYEGISDRLADNGVETSYHVDDRRGRSRGDPNRVHGRPGAATPVEDAQSSAHPGASLAAALTASSRLLALPPTPTAPIAEDVRRLDRLFAVGPEDGTSFVLPRSRRNLLRFSEEDAAL